MKKNVSKTLQILHKMSLKSIKDVTYFKLNNEQQKRFEDINWFKIVNHSIYRGKECVAALHIVSMFNENKDISEIKKYCDSEGFSGYAWNIVVNLVHELDLNISHQISNFYVGLGPYKAAEYLSLVP